MVANPKLLVIPDVHGRDFWKEAVSKYPSLDIVFLGDYLDPYPEERITRSKAIDNFKEILGFASNHESCRLLLGNHDVHYLLDVEGSRKDNDNSSEIEELFSSHIDLFDLVSIREFDNKIFLFSHAPLLFDWVKSIQETKDVEKLVDRLNLSLIDFKSNRSTLLKILYHISFYRGGFHECGSLIWSDVREVVDEDKIFMPEIDFNVFGHTQLEKPLIGENFACLDVRRAFVIDDRGKIFSV